MYWVLEYSRLQDKLGIPRGKAVRYTGTRTHIEKVVTADEGYKCLYLEFRSLEREWTAVQWESNIIISNISLYRMWGLSFQSVCR